MRNQATKPYKGLGMEGVIAKWYTATTRKSMPDFRALAGRVAAELTPGSRIVEVAPGPGFFAIELSRLGDFQITGLDISSTFVDIAGRNAREAGVTVEFLQGNASKMPFENDSFDFLLCRAAFKNFSEPIEAIREMHRVLKPGGRLLLIDLRRDASQQDINQEVEAMGLSRISTVMTKLTFRFMLLKRAYSPGEFERMFAQAPFHGVEVHTSLVGVEVRAVK
jgi:ubiquinone/menaquinone biosynthesis C-methylase UbiE